MAGGRPSTYSAEVADAICELIADGKSLRTICSAEDMPCKASIFKWLVEHKEFSDQYARARETQADTLADEILDISDDGANDTYETESGTATNHDVIARSRLRVDARKWYASKLAPKKYGEKVQQEITGKDGAPLITGIEVKFVEPSR